MPGVNERWIHADPGVNSFSQPPRAPDDLAAISLGIAKERRFDRIIVDGRLCLKDNTLALELGPGCRHVIDPESHVANPALVDVRLTDRPADDLERHALIVGEEEPRWIAAALEHDLHAKRPNIEVFERGCILSENREVFDS